LTPQTAPFETFQVDELFFKARPATEGDDRFVYCEPSNENRDNQREVVRRAALLAALPDFLKTGNLDLEHLSLLGPRFGLSPLEAKAMEIGHPIEAVTEPAIVVKCAVYRGEGQLNDAANFFWDSITKSRPPRRWYPSVGGRTLKKACGPDGCTVDRVVWTNIGLAKEPVNTTVKAVSLMPLATFAKAVTAGYTTDVAQLAGGQATQLQSIERGHVLKETQGDARYAGAAARYLRALQKGAGGGCEHTAGAPSLDKIVAHFRECEGADPREARAYATRLIRQIAHRTTTESKMAA